MPAAHLKRPRHVLHTSRFRLRRHLRATRGMLGHRLLPGYRKRIARGRAPQPPESGGGAAPHHKYGYIPTGLIKVPAACAIPAALRRSSCRALPPGPISPGPAAFGDFGFAKQQAHAAQLYLAWKTVACVRGAETDGLAARLYYRNNNTAGRPWNFQPAPLQNATHRGSHRAR